ncbi:MAG TPA: metallophosphoesterase family protein [Smithellaceae bacterium]|nr:metallophosphoesterase family protein [Smithellaceae bacterium]
MDEKKVKIGVISDTHLGGYDDKLKNIVARYFHDADIILHAGDLVDIGVLDIFGDKEVKAVCGNMDNDKTRGKLPGQLIFEIKGFKIGLIHGWGSPGSIEEKILRRIGKVDCVVYGHTHKPANHKEGDVLFFNPGSAAQRHFVMSRTLGILEVDKELTGRIINI